MPLVVGNNNAIGEIEDGELAFGELPKSKSGSFRPLVRRGVTQPLVRKSACSTCRCEAANARAAAPNRGHYGGGPQHIDNNAKRNSIYLRQFRNESDR